MFKLKTKSQKSRRRVGTPTRTSELKTKYIIGIDEVGRGPLAGPVIVAAVMTPRNFQFSIFNFQKKIKSKLKDSKKLTSKQREEWNGILRKNFECRYVSINNKVIDKIGIQKAIKLAVRKVLCNLLRNKLRNKIFIYFDGGLYLPKFLNSKFYRVRHRFTKSRRAGILNSRTIIKGDEKISVISAASIIAKVARDRKMMRFHKKYPKYSFDKHKGYGTKLHYKMIKKHKISKIHRRSFRLNG